MVAMGRKGTDDTDRLCAAEAVQFLTPDLLEFLADLYGAPASIAQGAVQLLPFGSRAALLATGLVTALDDGDGPAHEEILQLTDLAFEVIAMAASAAASEQIDELAAHAAAIVAARQRG
ncbi:hypothetical protein EV385_3971 [Krasilnikovia cinnamomea]|uniref:Uncharacterized protein n=1 Tax=Krasilnikovia cinnamomea TaxID=349313 RepID=A0A4Q7ZP87_9ACTN|nr:hypothetical protein [Krasilnikovia cinnamomea]RZU52129.1 hypothetical protein EV385_3971 [Krasilnikovia cinnamomea]